MVEGGVRSGRRVLARADAALNRLYGWRHNPLYHSGGIAVAMLVVLLGTGLWLLFFYRLSDPYGSIERVNGQWWAGRWMRALHRYSGDVGLVAVVVHAFRMFVQGRSWGPRALAWVSGAMLAGVFLVAGWTGYVMVWDTQAQLLATEGARLLDLVPLFAEPIGRTFVGERPLPNAFFFLNLFAHVALPVGLLLVLWIHVSRLARPALFPPRGLTWGLVGGLFLLSVLWPAALGPEANLFRVPESAPLDLFYTFWLPVAARVPASLTMAVGTAFWLVVLLAPWWTRPGAGGRPSKSVVEARSCTGCEQCYLDCPYEAIAMVARTDGRDTLLAQVNPALCVGCGICAGSCAPMGVGPVGRTGRDQLAAVRAFVEEARPGASDVVVVGCGNAVAPGDEVVDGSPSFRISCAGNLHTSTIEYLVRSGVAGVLVVSCPPRDCWSREGPKWLEQRVYFEREAELKARVDRARVRLVYVGGAEAATLKAALRAFRSHLAGLAAPPSEPVIDLIALCARDETEVGA